jgi:hypothetical protein
MSAPALAASKAPKTAPTPPPTAPSTEAHPVFEPDGRFGFCLSSYTYSDGRKMTVAQSPENQLNLGLTIPDAHFEVGARYDITLTLGSQDGRKIRGQAIDDGTLLLQMGASPKFRKQLVAAQTLSVGTTSKTLVFALPAMNPLFDSLKACLKQNKGQKNEAVAQSENALPETLKALLITAGFTDIIPMSMEGIPAEERPADYIWKTGSVLAGIRERKAPEGKSLADLIGIYMGGLKDQCPGTFKVDIEREQKEGGLTLRLASAVCAPKTDKKADKKDDKDKDPTVTVALLFYLTPHGGFTVFTHEGQNEGKTEALAARDKMAKAILSLAKTQAGNAQ